MEKILFTLFVTGQTSRSQNAIANLRKISRHLPPDQCVITIVDVLEHPALAEEFKVIATPTLIKQTPVPLRRIVGDLSDTALVLTWLGLADIETTPATDNSNGL